MNEDSSIDIFDAVDILSRAAYPSLNPACPWAGDVNGDGDIDIFDAVDELSHIADPSNTLSCKCQ